MDPEEAADRLGPLIQAMVSGIHKYGGTVIRSEGDAILALSAPHLPISHAVRACHSAFRSRTTSPNSTTCPERPGDGQLGEAMVARWFAMSRSNMRCPGFPSHGRTGREADGARDATRATIQLVEGLVNTTRLGDFEVRGLSDTIELFEVSSLPLSPAPWDARLALGLTPFVNRGFERNVLLNAAESARAGKGQLIELIGDAGVGKSRLVHELANASISADCRLLIGGTAGYAQSYPYFSFRDLFRKEFGITGQDDDAVVGEKLAARLSADPSLAHLVSAFRALLGLRATDPAWREIDPVERRRQTIAAARELSSASPARRPSSAFSKTCNGWTTRAARPWITLFAASTAPGFRLRHLAGGIGVAWELRRLLHKNTHSAAR